MDCFDLTPSEGFIRVDSFPARPVSGPLHIV